MAYEDLGDAFLFSEFDQSANLVLSFKDVDLCIQLPSNLKVLVECGFICRRQIGLTDISDQQVCMKSVRITSATFQDGCRGGPRRNADKDAFLDSPVLYDTVGFKVGPEFGFHDFCSD